MPSMEDSAARTTVPTEDLAMVEAPFKPLESAEAKNLSLKVAFLLAFPLFISLKGSAAFSSSSHAL